MPAQRTRAAFAPDQRSAHPGIAGVPPWAAVLIAVSATLAGFAFEAGSGHTELGFVFAAFYALGCIAAVLAVQHSGIFTAVIQPPLLLFVAVPLAYFLLHESSFSGLKDVLITCGYPLIERFPLMLFTSAAVLIIGLGRWYFSVGRDHSADQPGAHGAAAQPSMFAGLAARFASFSRPATDDEPRHGARSATRTARPPRAPRPERAERAQRSEPARSRSPRPARADDYDAPPRPRRQPPRERDPRERDPRDRPRRPRESTSRRTPPPPPRERRDPRDRSREGREGYAPRPRGEGRYEPYPPPGRGYESRPAPRDPYRDRYDYPGEPPRRRPAPGGSGDGRHPISGARYRGPDPEDPPRR